MSTAISGSIPNNPAVRMFCNIPFLLKVYPMSIPICANITPDSPTTIPLYGRKDDIIAINNVTGDSFFSDDKASKLANI